MRFIFFGIIAGSSFLLAMLSVGCVSTTTPAGAQAGAATGGNASIRLSNQDAEAIGRKIWKNECNGTVEGLTSWNKGEDFPSLGIGHFIWYVEGRRGPFEESFPPLIAYMKHRGAPVPRIAESRGSPWKSRSEFLARQQSPEMRELRNFLANTVSLQTEFIVQRLERALPKMKGATANPADRDRIHANFYQVAQSRNGVYALIDYVNFKGEGIKKEESYQGQGWGLRQVLLEMRPNPGSPPAALNEYSEAAKRVLNRRVQNAPSSRGESRWLAGWMNRCEGYKKGI